MKIKFNPKQLQDVLNNSLTLRGYSGTPPISFALANNINAIAIAVQPFVTKNDERRELYAERTKAVNEITDEDQKKKAFEELKAEITKANKAEVSVEIVPLKKADFEALEITGERIMQAGGQTIQVSYRDCYFDLVRDGCIV